MKIIRVLALVTALLLVAVTAFAEIDWASMDTAAIQAEILNAQAELAKRGEGADSGSTSPEDVTILDYLGLTIKTTSFEVKNSSLGEPRLYIGYIVENNTDVDFNSIMLDNPSINDWQVEHFGLISIEPGKKAKGEIQLALAGADITTYEEIENVTIGFYFWDKITNAWVRPDPVTINFK